MKKRTTFKEDLEVFGKVKVLTLTAMLVAMSVVIGILCKNFLTWNIYYRFTLENLPIFFAAIAFGPFIGAAAGVLADKDFNAGIDVAIPHAKKFFAVTPPSYRALDAGELAADIREKSEVPVAPFESIPAAIEAALAESDKDDVIAILGSLYQVGDVRSYFGRDRFS